MGFNRNWKKVAGLTNVALYQEKPNFRTVNISQYEFFQPEDDLNFSSFYNIALEEKSVTFFLHATHL